MGTIAGNVAAIVTLGHDGFLRTAQTDSSGRFSFKQVPYGKYFIKAEANGYAFGQAQTVSVSAPVGNVVHAPPTNPQAPNGETRVRIVFYAKDDKAGIRNLYYTLLDPQGISHNFYYAHASWKTRFFQGNPDVWTRYEITEMLPIGSAPGKWGLAQMELLDQAHNSKAYNFLEVLHFEIAP